MTNKQPPANPRIDNRKEKWEETARVKAIEAIACVANEEEFKASGLTDAGNLIRELRTLYEGFSFLSKHITEHGSGIGRMTHYLYPFFKNGYTCLDVSGTMLEKNPCPVEKLEMDVSKIPMENQSTDLIFSFTVLMHNIKSDVKNVFKEFHRILQKGGHVIFQLPVYRYGVQGETYSSVTIWTLQEVVNLAREAGFEILKLQQCDREMKNVISDQHFKYHIFKKK